MKQLSLQWRITLLTALLIGVTCVSMQFLLCSSGKHYMDAIGNYVQTYTASAATDSSMQTLNRELPAVIQKSQNMFCMINSLITAAITAASGIFAYFVIGQALQPLHRFTARMERVELNNLADMQIEDDTLPEFRRLTRSFNRMLERLHHAFETQRQFTGNAAHELRTPLALMQAQLELFTAEHPDVLPETAEFLQLLREQTERLTQMSKTLLEMSSLQSAARTDFIQLGPMIEEIFTDLDLLAQQRKVLLEREGDASLTGSDPLLYRMLFNLTENAIKYNRVPGVVRVSVCRESGRLMIRIADTGYGIPEEYRQSIFQPFFRVEPSRSRAWGGVGLGLSLVWEIAAIHGGSVWVEQSSPEGTTIAVSLPSP